MTDQPLRMRPGIIAGAVIVIGFAIGVLFTITMPDAALGGMVAALIGALAVVIWWLFFSRARWSERLGALAVMVVAWLAMRPFLDPSISGGGMGALPVFAVPLMAVALVVSLALTERRSDSVRRISVVVAIAIACGFCTLVQTPGTRGGFFEFHWRWTPTPEERLLAQGDDEPVPIPPPATPTPAPASDAIDVPPAGTETAAAAADPAATASLPPPPRKPAAWPGFRGPRRDGVVHGLKVDTDWSAAPPTEIWRRPIGPGWSSFAVDGDLIYTQEQRGDEEIVASYRLSTGQPVWRHRDAVRFYESNGGPGPRGTPTLLDGRVYAFGATGVLNVLDAGTGAVIWSRNVATDGKVELPTWGFSSSPLVVNDLVIVAAAGKIAAYDIATGQPRWSGPDEGFSYSSPHLMTIDGVPQIVLLRGDGATSFSPVDGEVLWRHAFPGGAIVQPALTADGNVLIHSIGGTGGQGIRRLAIAHRSDAWTVDERWTSPGLKPYFNDFVVHDGHAYGFDGSILSCINLNDGARRWKGGRYGGGQLVLLADQDVLLVLSDEGELALVSATADGFKELARFKAIEGKTWSHPVVVDDILLVRNGEEMAAFRLPTIPQ